MLLARLLCNRSDRTGAAPTAREDFNQSNQGKMEPNIEPNDERAINSPKSLLNAVLTLKRRPGRNLPPIELRAD